MKHNCTAVSLLILAIGLPSLSSAGQFFYSSRNVDSLNESLRLLPRRTRWAPLPLVSLERSGGLMDPFHGFFEGDSLPSGTPEWAHRSFFSFSQPKWNSSEATVVFQNDLIALADLKLSTGLRGRAYDQVGVATDLITSLTYSPGSSIGLTLLYGEPTSSFDTWFRTTENPPNLVGHEAYRTIAIFYEHAVDKSLRFSAAGSYHMETAADPSAHAGDDGAFGKTDYLGLGIKLEGRSPFHLEKFADYDERTQIEKVVDYLAEFRMMMPIVKDRVAANMEVPREVGFRLKLTFRF